MQDKRGWAVVVTATKLAASDGGDLIPAPASDEPIHHIPELPRNIRRVFLWAGLPCREPGITRMAHHEAGHIVFLEWLGITGASATATPTNGLTHLPEIKRTPEKAEPEDATGEITAQAAAMFHAGLMAELLYAGVKWIAPIRYPEHDDYCRADDLLSTRFGRNSSGAHAYSQCFALRILGARWDRVAAVARTIEHSGAWHGDKANASGCGLEVH